MCGRYVIAYDPQTLVAGFSVLRVPPFPRRWNVTPQSPVPVVVETRSGERIAELMRWGLVPSWAKDPAVGNKLANARAEGIFERPAFRQAIRRRRCLLPASGFYEWQSTPAGRQPWYFSPARADRGGLLAMAGLFEAWRPAPDAPWLLSCCVITTAANALMAPIHDRMPVLIQAANWAAWLARAATDPAAIEPMLVPAADGMLQAWPVSRAVSRAANEGPELVEPLGAPA
jgi:putative SOS response-associated peptidase YedK